MDARAEILVDFERMSWATPAAGLRTKTLVRGGQRARLMELADGFLEPDWCTRRHAFHVLDGRCSLEMREGVLVLAKGDIGLIPGGEPHAHRLVLGPGEQALPLVFDDVEETGAADT